MGDRILKVNGTDVTAATHQEAVMELLRPGDEIKLTIQHDPLPVGFQVSAPHPTMNRAGCSKCATIFGGILCLYFNSFVHIEHFSVRLLLVSSCLSSTFHSISVLCV